MLGSDEEDLGGCVLGRDSMSEQVRSRPFKLMRPGSIVFFFIFLSFDRMFTNIPKYFFVQPQINVH